MTRAHRRKAAPLARPPGVVPAPVGDRTNHQERLQAPRLKLVEECFEELVDLYEELFSPAQRTNPVSPEKTAALQAVMQKFRARQEALPRADGQARDEPNKPFH